MRAVGLPNVAFVWDYSCDEPDNSWTRFMLPNEGHYVDWYGVNIFSNSSAPSDRTCVRPFLDFARARGFPVLFAETTPRYVGANASQGAWDGWFGPFLAMISDFDDVVKGFDYIDWAWSHFPQWGNWGDARVEVQGSIGAQLRAALGGAGVEYVNAMPRDATLRVLGVA